MDLGVVIGTVGALSGVAMGGWLADRSQRRVLRETQRAELIRAKRQACVNVLATHRAFRRFLQTESVAVNLIPISGGSGQTPVVEGASKQWESLEQAFAELRIIAGGSSLEAAADELRHALYLVMGARADHPPGAVPDEIIVRARQAEEAFAAEARRATATRV